MIAERHRTERDERIDASDDDASAFREAMRGVRPIAAREDARAPTARRAGARVPAAARSPGHGAARADEVAFAVPIGAAAEHVPDRLAFRRPGVRDRQFRDLRRGALRVDDDLDLHGLTRAEAHPLLVEFLDASRDRGSRCVRIIHGKGLRSGGRGPVMKAAVDEWLRRRHDVLAFASARPADGGGGAVYVLLRG